MTYQITIEKLIDSEENKYPTKVEIYQQIVEELDIKTVIAVVNGLVGTP
jgi:predicted ATPase